MSVFVDTNVLVRLFDRTDDAKRTTARDIVREGLVDGRGCISWQVVQESLNVLRGKLGATSEEADRFLEDVLHPLWSVYPSTGLYRRGLQLQARYRLGWYDSLIVAAAQEARCATLLSEDLPDGQEIDRLVVRNPFAAVPPAP